jgi:hypothetical protein
VGRGQGKPISRCSNVLHEKKNVTKEDATERIAHFGGLLGFRPSGIHGHDLQRLLQMFSHDENNTSTVRPPSSR